MHSEYIPRWLRRRVAETPDLERRTAEERRVGSLLYRRDPHIAVAPQTCPVQLYAIHWGLDKVEQANRDARQ